MLNNIYIRKIIHFLLLISICLDSFAASIPDSWNDEINLYSEMVDSFYNICFDEKGVFLRGTIIYEGDNQIDCNKQAEALDKHLKQIESLSRVNLSSNQSFQNSCKKLGNEKNPLASLIDFEQSLSSSNQVSCEDGESDSECFESIACNAMMSFNLPSNLSVSLSNSETYLEYSEKAYKLLGLDIKESKSLNFLQSCAEKQSSTCLLSLLRGVWDSIWGLIDVAWEILKYAGKKIKDGYNYVVDSVGSWFSDVEDKTSDKMMLASQVDNQMLDKFLKDPLGVISEMAGVLYDSIVKGIREHYGCEKWSGIPFASECLKPMSNWDCATCGQKMNSICGVVGFAVGEIVTAFFSGGAAAVAKIGVTSSVKIAAKITTKVSKTLSKIPKLDDAFKIVSKGSQKLAGGMGHLSDIAYKSWLKLKDSFSYGKLKEALVVIKKGTSKMKKIVPYKIVVKTTKFALSPIIKYLKLMDKAFRRGFKQTSNALEGSNKVSRGVAPLSKSGETSLNNPKYIDEDALTLVSKSELKASDEKMKSLNLISQKYEKDKKLMEHYNHILRRYGNLKKNISSNRFYDEKLRAAKIKNVTAKMNELNDRITSMLKEVFQKEGIGVDLIERSDGVKSLLLTVSKDKEKNFAHQFFLRAQKKFDVKEITITPYDTAKRGNNAFYVRGERLELGFNEAFNLIDETIGVTARHELRHSIFDIMREKSLFSIYFQRFYASSSKKLHTGVGYTKYASLEEIYNFSTDVGTYVRNIKRKLKNSNSLDMKAIKLMKKKIRGVSVLSKITINFTEDIITRFDNVIEGLREGKLLLKQNKIGYTHPDGRKSILVSDEFGRQTAIDIYSKGEVDLYRKAFVADSSDPEHFNINHNYLLELLNRLQSRQKSLNKLSKTQREIAKELYDTKNSLIMSQAEEGSLTLENYLKKSLELSNNVKEQYKDFAGVKID